MHTDEEKGKFHPFVVQRASDWEDIVDNNVLLTDAALDMIDPKITKKDTVFAVANALPPKAMGEVTAVWFDEAVNGCHIRLPHAEFQVFCYRVFGSHMWTTFMLWTSVVQLLSIFFESPGCDFTGSVPGQVAAVAGYASSNTMTAVAIVTVLLQMMGIWMWYNSSPPELVYSDSSRLAADYGYRWPIIRGVCCTICLLDFIIYFGLNGESPRFSRCLFPVILISRQENSRLIVEGFLAVLKKTLFVIVLLAGILIFVAMLGLFLFRNMSRELGVLAFSTYLRSFYTVLHCFASRPTVLFILKSYVVESNAAPFFFVGETMVADLLIGTLLVATANRFGITFIMNFFWFHNCRSCDFCSDIIAILNQ
jgi:hypothetical protein